MKLLVNLKLSESDKTDLSKIPVKDTVAKKRQREEALKSVLTSGKPVINSSEILNLAAPEDSYDFFISHSHKDVESVSSIASFMREKGFKVFVDSEYWLYFDEIADELNKNHLHTDKGMNCYDHAKTIEVQKHCDVMLTASLLRVMSKSTILLFVNTPSSIVGMDAVSRYGAKGSTYSPWIYYEILTANALFEPVKFSPILEHYSRDSIPQIQYDNLDMNNMVNVSWNSFKRENWASVLRKVKGN